MGSVGPPVTIWYKPNYKHTAGSEVNITRLPAELAFPDTAGDSSPVRLSVKNPDGTLRGEIIPRVHIVKYGAYMDEDETGNPDHEVDILARIGQGLKNQADPNMASYLRASPPTG